MTTAFAEELLIAEEQVLATDDSVLAEAYERDWDEALAMEIERAWAEALAVERAWTEALAVENWRQKNNAWIQITVAAFAEQERLQAEWLADPMNRLRKYELAEEMKRIKKSRRKRTQ